MRGKPKLWKSTLCSAGVALVGLSPALARAQAGASSAATSANAPYRVGQIAIERPWILAPVPGASAAAAYFTTTDRGPVPDRLVRASSILAQVVRLGAAAAIGPGQTGSLAPESQGLELIGLVRPFQPGEKVPVTLTFERAGQLTAEFDVLASPPRTAAKAPPR